MSVHDPDIKQVIARASALLVANPRLSINAAIAQVLVEFGMSFDQANRLAKELEWVSSRYQKGG